MHHNDKSDDALIAKAVRASRAQGIGLWVFGFMMAGFGLIGVAWVGVASEFLPTFIRIMLGLGGLAIFGLGLALLYLAYSTHKAPAEIEHLLRHDPQAIRLVKRTVVKKTIEGVVEVRRDLYINILTEKNKEFGFEMNMNDGEAFLAWLKEAAPQATFR